VLALALGGVAACSNAPAAVDTGPAEDAFVRPDTGPCSGDGECPGSYCNAGSMRCCEPASPPYEICGDMIDQNCDHHDESCGDNDHDGIQACRAGEDPLGGCDCDDDVATGAAVRPPVGSVAGAPELCDGVDNDCNGRIDESAACCPACTALGTDGASRADSCTPNGECDCSGEPGTGPCATGLHCCSSGCVDVTSSYQHCGFCEAPCTAGSDTCVASVCSCGTGPACDFTDVCTSGHCMAAP
jgi:Notch-like protein